MRARWSSSFVMIVPRSSREDLVPFMKMVSRDDAVKDERVVLHELFRRFPRGEHAERSDGRVSIRPRHQQHTTLLELVQARAVGGEVLTRLGESIGGGLVKHQCLHWLTLS